MAKSPIMPFIVTPCGEVAIFLGFTPGSSVRGPRVILGTRYLIEGNCVSKTIELSIVSPEFEISYPRLFRSRAARRISSGRWTTFPCRQSW